MVRLEGRTALSKQMDCERKMDMEWKKSGFLGSPWFNTELACEVLGCKTYFHLKIGLYKARKVEMFLRR